MKKLAKLAALLAAGALALGFAACSGDDDNDPPKKPEVTATATLTGSASMLKIGEARDVKATLTVDGDTFIDGDIKSSIELTAGTGVTATVKTAEKSADKKSAELTISVTAAAGAQAGAITAKIKADALTDTSEPVTADGSIAYQIDDGKPYAELELDGDAVELDPEAEEPKEINATVTVGNTEFTEAARGVQEGNEILEEYFKLSASDENVTVSKAKVVAWGEDSKSVKISFTATAAADAKDGKITAEIYAGTLKDVSEPLNVAGSIAYTVKSATQTDPNPDEGDDPAVFVLEEASANISLLKTNIGTIADKANEGGKAYLSAATDNWQSDTDEDGNEVTYYNLSSVDRSLSITVKNVAGFTVYAKLNGANRPFKVKVGEQEIGTVSTTETGVLPFKFNTGTKDIVTIVLGGGGNGSVYPEYVVLYNEPQDIPAETVEITGKPEAALILTDYANGETYDDLKATVTPSWHTSGAVAWSSSATNVATIDAATGKITPVGAGTTKITAKVGEAEDSFELTVAAASVAVTGVTLKASTTIDRWHTEELEATITPDDASNKAIIWTTSDNTVATVDENGVVTAVAPGTATITATSAADSTKKAECAVTVNPVYVSKDFEISKDEYNSTALVGKLLGNNMYTTAKVDSNGIYCHRKISANGYTEFELDKAKTVTITYNVSSDKEAGLVISTSNGEFTVPAGSEVKIAGNDGNKKLEDVLGTEKEGSDTNTKAAYTSVTSSSSTKTDYTYLIQLTAGTYKLYGSTTSTSAKASKIVFADASD